MLFSWHCFGVLEDSAIRIFLIEYLYRSNLLIFLKLENSNIKVLIIPHQFGELSDSFFLRILRAKNMLVWTIFVPFCSSLQLVDRLDTLVSRYGENYPKNVVPLCKPSINAIVAHNSSNESKHEKIKAKNGSKHNNTEHNCTIVTAI